MESSDGIEGPRRRRSGDDQESSFISGREEEDDTSWDAPLVDDAWRSIGSGGDQPSETTDRYSLSLPKSNSVLEIVVRFGQDGLLGRVHFDDFPRHSSGLQSSTPSLLLFVLERQPRPSKEDSFPYSLRQIEELLLPSSTSTTSILLHSHPLDPSASSARLLNPSIHPLHFPSFLHLP